MMRDMDRSSKRLRVPQGTAIRVAAVAIAAIVLVLVTAAGFVYFSQTRSGSQGSTTSSNSTTTSSSTTSSGMSGGISLTSAEIVKPYTPAGPTVVLILQNKEGCCVTNLTATLELNNNYTFRFGTVSAQHPLGQGQFASAVETLIGGGINSNANYPVTIKGTMQDRAFVYTTQTRIPPGYSALEYLTASANCTSSGAPAPCWGSDPFVFQCINLLAGPATQWECAEKVTSTLQPSQTYTMTVTLPLTSQTGEPVWANCLWSVPGITPGQGYAYFIPVNSTGGSVAFILGQPAPPHL